MDISIIQILKIIDIWTNRNKFLTVFLQPLQCLFYQQAFLDSVCFSELVNSANVVTADAKCVVKSYVWS